MCLSANVPLIESGTTGFNGQVQVIKKVASLQCYDGVRINCGIESADGSVTRDLANATIVIQRRFRSRFRFVLYAVRRASLFIVLYGRRAIFFRTSLSSVLHEDFIR